MGFELTNHPNRGNSGLSNRKNRKPGFKRGMSIPSEGLFKGRNLIAQGNAIRQNVKDNFFEKKPSSDGGDFIILWKEQKGLEGKILVWPQSADRRGDWRRGRVTT